MVEHNEIPEKKKKNKIFRLLSNLFGSNSKTRKFRKEKTKEEKTHKIMEKGKKIKSKISNKLDEEDKKIEEKKARKEEQKKERKFKFGIVNYIQIAAGAILFAFIIVLIFDVSNFRTTFRDGFLNLLIENERNNIEAELRIEYEEKFYIHLEENLSDERDEINNEYIEIESMKQDLIQRESLVIKKEEELAKLTDEVETIELSLELQKNQLQGKISEIIELSKLYEDMESKNAAAILTEMTDEVLVRNIISNLKKDKAAEILSLMEPAKAADIISDMID